jgi:hypothetical protein
MPFRFKPCPFCKEKIRRGAVKCRFCGEWLDTPSGRTETECGHTPSPAETTDPASVASAPESFSGANQSDGVGTATNTTKSPVSEPSAAQIITTPIPQSIILQNQQLIPLFLIALWVFCYVMPRAIKNGASGWIGIIPGTLSYCTSPVSLLVLLILAGWFWSSRRDTRSVRPNTWLTIVMCLLVVALAYVRIRPALESRAAVTRQGLLPSGVNPDALNDWEVLKRDQQASNAAGLTPSTKKRMREIFALQLSGNLAAVTDVIVDLQGEDHDKLVVACSKRDPVATNLREVVQQADVDFWNRMRFFDFSEVVFTGAKRSESIPKSKFKEWSHNYETYVSNMLATYQGQFFDAGGNDLTPTMQKTMRQNFASVLDGGMKKIYKSLEVRLEGENEDKMVFHLREMNARLADEMLKTYREEKTGNFWNGLRAMGCTELILSGDNYRRSIPQNEFVQWCRDYEKYLSELHKVVGQFSGGLKQEAKSP